MSRSATPIQTDVNGTLANSQRERNTDETTAPGARGDTTSSHIEFRDKVLDGVEFRANALRMEVAQCGAWTRVCRGREMEVGRKMCAHKSAGDRPGRGVAASTGTTHSRQLGVVTGPQVSLAPDTAEPTRGIVFS